jgi:hypothetical protein
MATGINRNGGVVSVGDSVSILGKVVSVSGSGSKATVTVQSPLDSGTYSIQANDANAVQQFYDGTTTTADSAGSYPAVSLSGDHYGTAGDDLTVLGTVTAISGSGVNALLTVKLVTSGNSITTAAGNCNSGSVNAGAQ